MERSRLAVFAYREDLDHCVHVKEAESLALRFGLSVNCGRHGEALSENLSLDFVSRQWSLRRATLQTVLQKVLHTVLQPMLQGVLQWVLQISNKYGVHLTAAFA